MIVYLLTDVGYINIETKFVFKVHTKYIYTRPNRKRKHVIISAQYHSLMLAFVDNHTIIQTKPVICNYLES